MKSRQPITLIFLLTFLPSQSFSPTLSTNPNLRYHFIFCKMVSPKEKGTSTCNKTSSTKSRRLYNFEEARKIARGHGFNSKQEFLEYDCPGAYQIPKDADVVWSEDWRGWDDFLGVPLSFEESRKVARALQDVATKEDYLNLMKSKRIPSNDAASRLPYRPDLLYKEVWTGWDDFLMGE